MINLHAMQIFNYNCELLKSFLRNSFQSKKLLEVNVMVDLIFSTFKEQFLNLFSSQEKLSPNLEVFEDKLHHDILSTITVNNNSFIDLYFLKVDDHSETSNFFTILCGLKKNYIPTEKNYFH